MLIKTTKKNSKSKIHTTINIKPWLKAEIYDVSVNFNIPMSKIIALIIIKIMHKSKIKEKMFESVKYQEKNKSIKWRKLHVSYDPDIYEKVNDMRKIGKNSVSKIIAEGIEIFLYEIVMDLKNNKKDTDNYPHKYIFTSNFYKGIYYFTIFWNFPPSKFLKKYIK